MKSRLTLLIGIGVACLIVVAIVLLPRGTDTGTADQADKQAAVVQPGIMAREPVIAMPAAQTSEPPLTQDTVPVTGETPQTPALEPEIRAALKEMLNTSSEGLVEEQLENGGTRIDLQGRFRTAPVAIIDADGEVQIRDYTYLPKE